MSEKNNSISTDRSLPKSSFVTEKQVRLLYMQAPISNSVVIIISLLYYFILQPRLDSNLLLLWMMMLLVAASYRIYLWYSRKSRPEARSAASWLNHYLIGCGLVGGAWSLIYPFLYVTNDPFVLGALLMLAFGVISSAVPILSVSIPAFILYTYPQGLILFITLLRFEDTAYSWLAFAVGVYLIMTTLFTRNTNRSILQSIRLQEENATLIKDLNNEINQRETLIAQRTLELEETNNDMIIEIKDRERTKERLQQANADLDATLRAIPDLLFELDENGKYLDVWTHDTKLLAARKEALIGQTVTEVLPADAARTVMTAIQGAAETGTSHDQVIKMPLNHDVHWFELSTSKKQCTDSSSRFLMLSRDITERKGLEIELRESESRFRTMFEGAQDGILVVDVETKRFVNANPTMCAMTGYELDELLAMGITDFHPQADLPHVQEQFEKQVRGESVVALDIPVLRKDGNIFPANISVSPMEINGRLFMVGFFRDITERKKIDKQLQQSHKMEAIGTLAGGIAHDFNNILASILGYSEIARDQLPADDQIRKDLDQVIKAGHRATDLVKQLLTFSRQREEEFKTLKVQLIIKEILKLLRASLPTTIQLKESIATDSGPTLADPTQIHQVLMNLCTNAKHAIGGEIGTLSVSLSEVKITDSDIIADCPQLERGSYLDLEISDTGCGMDALTQSKIFNPFFTTKETGKGTGLGLAVVHGIIKQHKGEITVASDPGQGTTFHIYLPVIEEEMSAAEQVVIEDIPRGSERVLVVDDETDVAHMMQRKLHDLGYTVTVFTSSIEALETYKKNPGDFDLVITDMTMPEMTGTALVEKLLALRPDLPVILCTGYSETVDEEKAKSFGIREYIMKPIDTLPLAKAIRRSLTPS